MENLVLLLMLVCTLHGLCVSLECYNCQPYDYGCEDFSFAIPDIYSCPDEASVCQVTTDFMRSGSKDFSRSCISEVDCKSNCSSYSVSGNRCQSCCSEDFCNRGDVEPFDGSISCYGCNGSLSAACNDDFNPADPSVEMVTCTSGQCAIYHDKEGSQTSIVHRGCPATESSCWPNPHCTESGCVSCCEGHFCNGQVMSSLYYATTSESPKIALKSLTGPSGATIANIDQDDDQDDDQDGDQDDTGKGTRLSKPCGTLIISLMGSLLRLTINNY